MGTRPNVTLVVRLDCSDCEERECRGEEKEVALECLFDQRGRRIAHTAWGTHDVELVVEELQRQSA